MKLVVLRVGKGKTRWADEACDDYGRRIGKHLPIEEHVIATARTVQRESEALLARIKDRDRLVVLDPGGTQVTTEELATVVRMRRESAPRGSCSRSVARSDTRPRRGRAHGDRSRCRSSCSTTSSRASCSTSSSTARPTSSGGVASTTIEGVGSQASGRVAIV